MVRVAINGFGRIGRTALRIAHDEPEIKVVAINDLTDAAVLAHLLKFDSNYGRFGADVTLVDNEIVVDGTPVRVFAEPDPLDLPWCRLGIDVVIESTGRFTSREGAATHIEAGADGVVISAPAGSDVPTFVIGVNEQEMKREDAVISNASCTTNCLGPVAKVLHRYVGIERGLMTTVHAYTSDQMLQDGPHKDLRRARAAAANLVPTSTGAAQAIGLVLPELAGKLHGFAVRAPLQTGSLVDLTFDSARPIAAEEINAALQVAAEEELNGILAYTNRPIVSSDIVGDSHSAIVDGLLTTVLDERLVKVVAWYDNEYGYASRLVGQAINLGRVQAT
jgi:glyceraldehyde 3-phosphate dehydrogenase